MATRCFWPPDRRPTAACANFSSPTLVRCSIATFSASALLIFLSVTGASVQLSSTSMLLNRLKPWNTMPMSSRSLLMLQRSAVRSWPWNQMWPASGVSSRLRQRRKVDLPEPRGADDGDDLAGIDGQVDALEYLERAEALAQALDADERLIGLCGGRNAGNGGICHDDSPRLEPSWSWAA